MGNIAKNFTSSDLSPLLDNFTMDQLERTSTGDTLASDAVGGEHLGKRYYLSLPFIGTILGTSLSLCSAYAAYLLPVGILSYINASVGKPIISR